MSGDAERGLFWSTCAVRVACLVVCSLMHTRMISVDVLNGVKSMPGNFSFGDLCSRDAWLLL